jgi:hypothetical protein
MLSSRGKKGRIAVSQFADLTVPDRDFFACADAEIADTTAELTTVGGAIVYGAGPFAALDDNPVPPAKPDWSPIRPLGATAPGASGS